ncbi:MAG: FHA domain-containing protein [Deltaproteobacteria bacterium]|nr:FHA domain-containing protein [Deltaproteobacteria bacterium]MBN2672908.1 FHA domain-containing protein [Deltaproteobacteria bacterium]
MADYSDGETKVVSRKANSRDSIIPVTIRPTLTISNGPDAGKKFYIEESCTTVGRSKEADIQLDDEVASRLHAEIHFNNMEFRIKDLQSSNGTFLNGSSVIEYALRHNDKIMIGETMLHFTIDRI